LKAHEHIKIKFCWLNLEFGADNMEKEKESPENNCSEQPKFENIDENRLLCSEAFERDCRDFDCDCNPSKRDKKEGRACGSDCINRILLMECWGRCVSGKYCTNRRFQNVWTLIFL
jgi:hypothetical protein